MQQEMKIFTEIGYGNTSFISTEVEIGEYEHRLRGFVRMKLVAAYFRIWIGKTVVVLSTNNGFEVKNKSKRKFKVLLGFYGRRIQIKP